MTHQALYSYPVCRGHITVMTSLPPFAPPPASMTPTSEKVRYFAAPVGCDLIIRDVQPEDNLKTVEVVQHAIDLATKETDELTITFIDGTTLFKVEVMDSFRATDSYCYVTLAPAVATKDIHPRPDLLQPWIAQLQSLNDSWSVGWSPQKRGKDKALCLKATGASLELPLSDRSKMAQTLKSALKDLGYPTPFSWALTTGKGVGLKLQTRAIAQELAKASPLTIPGFSHPIHFAPFRQIEPIYAFELVITGLSDLDPSFMSTLDAFFISYTTVDGETAFASSRYPQRGVYCFLLKDWQSTAKVLSGEGFTEFLKGLPGYVPAMYPPRLLWQANLSGSWGLKPTAEPEEEAGSTLERAPIPATLSVDRVSTPTADTTISRQLDLIHEDYQRLWNLVNELKLSDTRSMSSFDSHSLVHLTRQDSALSEDGTDQSDWQSVHSVE